MDQPPILPDLTLLRKIGVGSYGDVWLARTLTGVYRAVKIVDRARFPDDRPFQRELEGITRFQRAAGDQPRQLALLHVGRLEAQGLLYYVMELADDVEAGTDIDPERYEALTLKALRARRPVLPAAECVRLGVELARGLAGLHSVGLIHRDVKPSNIILVGGVPKLADIGLVSSREASVTALGTPGYSPPEGAGSLSADLWGLGRVLYELVTGLGTKDFPRLPADFDRRDDAAVLLELNEVVLRACEPEPQDRYANAQQMLDDLLLIQAGRSVKDLNRLRARLRTVLRVAGVAAAVAVAVIMGLGVKNYFTLRKLAAQETAARVAAEHNERLASYTANLNVAQLAVNDGNLGVARAALRHGIPSAGGDDLRGLEWYALWNESTGDAVQVFGQIGDPGCESRALAPDGGTVVAVRAGPRGEVVEWNLATGNVRTLADGVYYLGGFTVDQSRVIARLNDATLRLVDVATGQFSGSQANDVQLFASAGDGRSVVLGSPAERSTQLRVWDVIDQAQVAAWDLPADLAGARIAYVDLSPDRRLLAVHLEVARGTVQASEVIVWDLVAQAYRFRRADVGQVGILRFSRNGTNLVIGSMNEPWWLLDSATGTVRQRFADAPSIPSAAAFAPDDRFVACGGYDGVIKVFDTTSGSSFAVLRGHEGYVTSLDWLSDGRLLSTSLDGTIRTWNVPPSSRALVRGTYWNNLLGNPVLSNDGATLVATLPDGRLTRVDLGTLAPVGVPFDAFQALGFSSEGLRALNRTRELVVIDLATDVVQPTGLRLEGSSSLRVVEASSDASIVLLGQADGTVIFWDSATHVAITPERRHEQAITSGAVSPDGDWALTGDRGGHLWLWRPREGRAVQELLGSTMLVAEVAFSPDARRAVVISRDRTIVVWRLDPAAVEATRYGPPQGGNAAVFTIDGSRLITAGFDGLLTVWSIPEFRPIAILSFQSPAVAAGNATICSLKLARDGQTLIAFTESGYLRRWDLRR